MEKNRSIENKALKVLILEDSLQDLELMVAQLSAAGYQLDVTHTEEETGFREALKNNKYDIILSDFKLPGFDAFGALELSQEFCPEVPFICVSGSIGEELAIKLLKKGALDVLKDRPDRLPFAIKNALAEAKEKAARILAFQKLEESENRFRQVAETAREWIWEVDTKGMYTYASSVIESLLGYTPDEVVGQKHFYDFFISEKKEEMKQVAFEVFAKKEVFRNFENTNVHRNGNQVVLSTSGCPIFDDAGNLTGYRGVDENITGRKLAEEELQKSHSNLEEYFENDISADYVAGVSGEIFSCNKTFLKIFGFEKKSETEKFDVTQLYKNPEDRKKMIRLIEKQGKVENYEVEFITNEGKNIFTLINAIGILDNNDKIEKIRGYVVDITGQKEAEEKLRVSESRFRKIYEDGANGMVIVNRDFKFLMANHSFCLMTGYQEEELQQLTFAQITHPDDRNKDIQTVKKLISGETNVYRTEKKYIKKDGGIFWGQITVSSIYDTNGEFLYNVGIIVDITEHIKAEEKLKLLNRAVEASSVSVEITDVKGNINYVNPYFTELTGYSYEEVQGKNPRILKSGHHPKAFYEELWNTILSGKDWTGEFQNKKKNGELYWEKAVISPILNSDGKIVNFVAIKEDITERKRFEDTRIFLLEISQLATKQITATSFLTEVHQKLKKIIRSDNLYVALYNETDQTYTFPYHVDEYDTVEMNKAYDFSNSYTDHVLKTNQSLIVTPENQHEVEQDGTLKWYGDQLSVWLGVPFKTNEGSKTNGVIAIQDYQNMESYTETDKTIMEIIAHSIGSFIERLKYMEDLVQAREKAEESDRLKSAFLANMSHEIRTPMNGILGFTDLLLTPDLSSEEKESYIKIVHQSGQRMLNTVTDIVEISKIEAGLVQVSKKETDFNKRVEELFHFFQAEAEKKGLKLILEKLLPVEEKMISTDKNKLDSILTNLIKNAIKYTLSGTINMGCQSKGNFAEFYIKDTGIGIPVDRQEAVFERFMQADVADTRVFEGSGLGLAIAKSYVEMLGGKIWLESEEGVGSTFYFTLPLTNFAKEKSVILNEIPVDNANNKVKSAMGGPKILVAEDDEYSLLFIETILSKYGIVSVHAKNGEEAVTALKNNPDITLILMDIRMPVLDGLEAIRKIRQFNKAIPIIAQTAYAFSSDKKKAMEAGCNDYISKPIIKEKLLALIRKYI